MSSPPTEPRSARGSGRRPPGRLRRWAKRLGAACFVVLIVAIAAGLVVRHREASRWPRLSEVPPIEIAAAPLPLDDEAWALLLRAADARENELDLRAELRPVGPPAEADLVLWQGDVEAFAHLEAAVARPGLTVPRPDYYLDEFPDLLPHQSLTRSLCLRGWDRALRGDGEGALDDMLFPMQLGQRLLDCETALVPAIIGVAIEGIALKELAELLDTVASDRADLMIRAADTVLALSESPSALVRAVAWECAAGEEVYRLNFGELQAGQGDAADMGGLQGMLLYRLGYDADMTIVWHRQRCGDEVQQAALPWFRREPRRFDSLWPWIGRPSVAQVLHNPAGRILIQQYRPIFTNMVEREDRLRAIQRGHALVWAARAYALDHQGELPPSAGDLVPDYIDHLPDDPFADAPLQMEGDQVFSAADRKERIVAEIASLRWSITPPTTVEAD